MSLIQADYPALLSRPTEQHAEQIAEAILAAKVPGLGLCEPCAAVGAEDVVR